MFTQWLVLGKSPRGTTRVTRFRPGAVFAVLNPRKRPLLTRIAVLHQLVEEILMRSRDDHLVHEKPLFGDQVGTGIDGSLDC